MDQERLLDEILGIVAVLADEIYFRKCMFYNVPELSKAEKDTDPDLMTDNQDYLYTHACYAVTGLCEFINNYEG